MNLPISKSESFRIFDAIAIRYDFVNSVLSLGLHGNWRRKLRRYLPSGPVLKGLDLATGTADVALEMVKDKRVFAIDGLDLSEEMLSVGRRKVSEAGLAHKIQLNRGDAERPPFDTASFDFITISFGIRNVKNVLNCLSENYRLLKPKGRMLVLEFGLPDSRYVRKAHLFYLRNVLPHIGRFLTGHKFAYSYLNQTIEDFPYGKDFLQLFAKAGFKKYGYEKLTFGVVHLYWGEKD